MSDDLDTRLREALRSLDPEIRDPGYWHRFHRWAVNTAGPELARRRRTASATVSDVVLSWWRTLVPTAALVAALAGVALLRTEAGSAPVAIIRMDELLLEGADVPVLPAFDAGMGAEGDFVLVDEVF